MISSSLASWWVYRIARGGPHRNDPDRGMRKCGASESQFKQNFAGSANWVSLYDHLKNLFICRIYGYSMFPEEIVITSSWAMLSVTIDLSRLELTTGLDVFDRCVWSYDLGLFVMFVTIYSTHGSLSVIIWELPRSSGQSSVGLERQGSNSWDCLGSADLFDGYGEIMGQLVSRGACSIFMLAICGLAWFNLDAQVSFSTYWVLSKI